MAESGTVQKEMDALKKKNEELAREIEYLKGNRPNLWVTSIINKGFMSDEEAREHLKDLNREYDQFFKEFGAYETNKHIKYTVNRANSCYADGERRVIKDKKHYLLTSLARYRSRLLEGRK